MNNTEINEVSLAKVYKQVPTKLYLENSRRGSIILGTISWV